MFKPSATIHRDPKGKVKVLVCSEDFQKCIDAYKECTESGDVVLIRKGHFDKSKKVESKEQIAAKAKARTEAEKKRAKDALIEAEAAAAATAETAKQALAALDALKPKKAAK